MRERTADLMTQAYLPEAGARVHFRQVPVPTPGRWDVLVRINVATMCALTDLGIIAGLHPPHHAGAAGMLPHDMRVHLGRVDGDPLREFYPTETYPRPPFPTVMGHEGAGTIVALGPGANSSDELVFPDQPLAQGDRVATIQLDGAYGEYSVIESKSVIKIPEYMSDDEASLLEPLMGNYNCLRHCWAIRSARTVAVLGQGCQGLMATQVARALGAELIIASEPLAHRRAMALELGADVALDPTKVHVVDEVLRLTKSRGVDLVAECAGVSSTIQAAPYMVRHGGILAQIGAHTSPVTFDYGLVHLKHFMIIPSDEIVSFRQHADQVREILDLIKERRIRLAPLVTHRFGIGEINDAFDLLRSANDGVVKIAIDLNGYQAP